MLYPFTFTPVYKETLWGGTGILPYKGYPEELRKIGESWELSHMEHNYSVVANGTLAGKTIDALIRDNGERLLGAKVMQQYGHSFPLLIKFIDACDNLSVQVHPNDRLAGARHQSFGKTEMWYVVKAAPDAVLYSGLSQQIDGDEYVRRVEDGSIMDVLQKHIVKSGDVFFLPAGRIHAIGAGCFIAEIQQSSNITYRIYDFHRRDANGYERELHTELAKEAIDYTVCPNYQTHYVSTENEAALLVQCPYFTTNLLHLNQTKQRDFSSFDSFIIYICMEGKAVLKDNKGNMLSVQQGQTILIPAETEYLTVDPESSVRFLETYIAPFILPD